MRSPALILYDVEMKRAEMVEIGTRIGLSDPETVRVSQELDRLLNEHTAAVRAEKRGRKQNMGNPLLESEIEEMDFGQFDAFEINNQEQLTWAMRKIRAYKEKEAQINALADAEIKRINDWKEKEIKDVVGSITRFQTLAEDYGKRCLAADPKFKGETTPYGKISFKKQPPKYSYTDEAKTIEFLEKIDNLAGHVKVSKTIADKTKIKKDLEIKRNAFVKDGEVIDMGLEVPNGWQGMQYLLTTTQDQDSLEIIDMESGEMVNDVHFHEVVAVVNGSTVVPGLVVQELPQKFSVSLD